jgi:SAM-dependent methyltransferase
VSETPWANAPWEHPDWYDIHDTTWTAGPEREAEHYRELVIALPPLDAADHLLDAGCGTGKLAALIARGYPKLGRVTLLEPNASKLERAVAKLRELLPKARVDDVRGGLGEGEGVTAEPAGVVVVGSVLMPIMEFRGGTFLDGLAWLRAALADLVRCVRPGGWLYDVETLAAPWARGGPTDPVRRLTLPELTDEIARAGFDAVECAYRFRDRVIVKARRPSAPVRRPPQETDAEQNDPSG